MNALSLLSLAVCFALVVMSHLWVWPTQFKKWSILLRLYYRNITLLGAFQKKPIATVVVSNHPNAFVDPFVIEVALGIKLTRTIRSDWTRHWLVGRLVNLIGAVPLASKTSNGGAFSHLIASMKAGRAVILFPEGESHNRPRVKPFRKGTAHLIKQYIQQTQQPVRVVQVATYYGDKSKLYSDVWVKVADDQMYTNDQFDIETETKRWQENIASALPAKVHRQSKDRLNWLLNSMVSLRPEDLSRLNLSESGTNSEVNLLKHWLCRQQYYLCALRDAKTVSGHAQQMIAQFIVFLIGLPIAVAGALLNGPAAIAHYLLVRHRSFAEDKWASNSFVIGLAWYPTFWLILSMFSIELAAIAVFSGVYANQYWRSWNDRKRKLIMHFTCFAQPSVSRLVQKTALQVISAMPQKEDDEFEQLWDV